MTGKEFGIRFLFLGVPSALTFLVLGLVGQTPPPQTTGIQLGPGLLMVTSPGGPTTIGVDTAAVAMFSAPPKAWPPEPGWCQSSGQIASDVNFRYGCFTQADGKLRAQRWLAQTAP